MVTLIVDGAWSLKRNFFKRKGLVTNSGENCGGTFGFIDSLRTTINRVMPDRVIVFWDGAMAGKLRYEIYKPYKSNRKKKWNKDEQAINSDIQENDEDKETVELLEQKIKIKNYLEDLYVRQLECEFIEADDLIALYILGSKIPDEHIIINSRDQDFLQLISKNVSILSPDSMELITIDNFKEKFGYCIENALLMKCFEGDSSDVIKGVSGVSKKGLLEYFPKLVEEKVYYNKMVEESYDGKLKHKIKFFDKIINARSVLYRNAKLMDLKRPFVNEGTKKAMYEIVYGVLGDDRKISNAMTEFVRGGYSKFVGNEYIDVFFSGFYRLMGREMEFKKQFKT